MPRRARLALRLLVDIEVQELHERALGLLEAEGLADGAIEAAMRAPSTFALDARVADSGVVAGAGRGLLAAGGGGLAGLFLPPGASHARPATAADLVAASRLADALPEVDLIWGPPLLPAAESRLGAVQLCLAASGKHVHVGRVASIAEAEALAAVGEALAGRTGSGGAAPEAGSKRQPQPASLSVGADERSLGAALAAARAGLPVAARAELAAPPAQAGDLAGALARLHASVLAACAAVQEARPGGAFLYSIEPSDEWCGGAAGTLFTAAAAQLATFVGLPALAPVLLTRSAASDWQASSENSFASLHALLAGADVVVGAGTLAAGRVFSPVQLVLDSEIHSWNGVVAAGIPVDEESIALDPIKEVGIAGNYLGQRHTRRHMKDVWRPRVLDRTSRDPWIAGGRRGAPELALELCERMLEEHRAPPLEGSVADRINEIVFTSQ
jgi:trimethylamine--corrinoid protein Co-methyltransferase